MDILRRTCRTFLRLFTQSINVKLGELLPCGRLKRPLVRSLILAAVFGLFSFGEASATYKFAHGDASPFKGNRSSDLVTVHVHIAVNMWNLGGSIFDSGSIILPNSLPKGKGGKLCGEDAADCVCVPAMFLLKSIGFKQIRQGNEVSYLRTMMYPVDVTWQRLPGPLVVRLYIQGYPLSGMPSGVARSEEIQTTAGGNYYFDIGPEQVPGGTTIRINAR